MTDRHVQNVGRMSVEAEQADGPRCVEGEAVFYYEHWAPLAPGHIYSRVGLDEYKISQLCEYHFDSWTQEDPKSVNSMLDTTHDYVPVPGREDGTYLSPRQS